MSKIIDTHTHIYDEQFQEDFDDVMKNTSCGYKNI